MWLSDRRTFLTFLAAGSVGACGFAPVYGPGGTGEGVRDAITIAAPDNREGFHLVKQLESRLSRNLSAPYRLTYKITTRTQGMGVTPSQEITRTQVLGAIEYQVIHAVSGDVVNEGFVSNFTSYSSEGSTVSTVSVERDAYRRLMISLADMITTRLVGGFSSWSR